MNAGTIITLTVDRPAHGGYCVGRLDGKAVFVRFALPGETVRARIVQDKAKVTFAHAVEIVTPAAGRVTPGCPHFTACGGCHWQHADYAESLAIKRTVVQEQFARVAGMPDAVVQPVIPSPDPYGYRAHVTLHGTPNGSLGYVGMDARNALVIESCPIARPEVNAAIDKIRMRRMSYAPGSRLRVQVGDGDDRFVTARMAAPESGDDDDAAAQQYAGDDAARTPFVTYTVKGRTFRCSAGAFFQANTGLAEALIDAALARLDLTGGETVLDLYAGGGLFSAFLADGAAKVIAVESAPLAAIDARYNLVDRPTVEYRADTVENAIAGLTADAALVDPPRAGMTQAALAALAAANPARIAYVSCDPGTLARDAKRLGEAGYRLIDVQPVDMFPQTYHVECVAGFARE